MSWRPGGALLQGWVTVVAALGGLLLACALAPSRALTQSESVTPVAVIGNAGTTPSQLTADELQGVFLRKRLNWPSGHRVIVFNFPAGNAAREVFDRVVLGFAPMEAARYWIDARIRTGLQPPTSVPSPASLVRVIERLPGSIGYVPASQPTGKTRVLARVTAAKVLPP